MHDNDEFEAYLRQFTPRLPLLREVVEPDRPSRWRGIRAVAAAVLVAGAGVALVWPRAPEQPRQQPPATTQVTWGALRHAALRGAAALDTQLEASAAGTLVAVDHSGAALAALARE